MLEKSRLRAYQDRVITRLYESDAIFAVLKMGAGKTVCALTAIGELILDQVIRHALIIAPKRVATIVWPDEIREWAHLSGLCFQVLDEGRNTRKAQIRKALAGEVDVTIIGVDNTQWLVNEIAGCPPESPIWDLLVIDETSRFKTPQGKRAKALATIADHFKIRWGLTGTPRPNSLLDLFMPAKLITGGQLWGRSFYAWQKRHFYPTDFQGYLWRVLPGGHEEQLLADFASMSITLRDDEMPELPGLNVVIDHVHLPDDARRAYRQMERRLFAKVDLRSIEAASQAVATGKLAQISNGFLYGEGGDSDVVELHDAKIEWLAELVESLGGEPLIIIYEFHEDLRRILQTFPGTLLIGPDGGDPAAVVAAWNSGQVPLLAMHPASGGHGLNLQAGGSRFAWYSPTWSAELWEQTLARLWRPGQKDHVTAHVCVALDTVDEMKRMRVVDKVSAAAAFEAYLRSHGLGGYAHV